MDENEQQDGDRRAYDGLVTRQIHINSAIVESPLPQMVVGSETTRMWSNVGAIRIERSIDEVLVPPAEHHLVLVNIGRPFRLEERLDGRSFQTSGGRGDVGVIPAGLPAEFRTREREPQEVQSLALLLHPSFVESVAGSAGVNPDAIELAGVLGGRDPHIEQVGMALLSELENGGLLGDLYADSLATALAVHLLRNHSSLGRRETQAVKHEPARGLSRPHLTRVTDYIADNLEGRLTLVELANVVGMSSFHFSRMFKLATGLTPHQFVLARRIERAQELLTRTDLPLTEIALRSGFADQSHLAKHTRRHLGVSPAALRRSSK